MFEMQEELTSVKALVAKELTTLKPVSHDHHFQYDFGAGSDKTLAVFDVDQTLD